MLLRRDALSLLAIFPVLLALAVQVPYCGDYTEANAWNDGEKRMYAKYLSKRQRMEAMDRADIKAMVDGKPSPPMPGENKAEVQRDYRNVALNPKDEPLGWCGFSEVDVWGEDAAAGTK